MAASLLIEFDNLFSVLKYIDYIVYGTAYGCGTVALYTVDTVNWLIADKRHNTYFGCHILKCNFLGLICILYGNKVFKGGFLLAFCEQQEVSP